MMKPGVIGRATFSPDGRCRFHLEREWDRPKGLVLYVGLNPSKAGKDNDDMTVTKGMGFARSWGMGATMHGNAYPFISTDPRYLVACTLEERARNDEWLLIMARHASVVVLAWGSYPKFARRFQRVAQILSPFNPVCLGRTKDGYPRHISRLGYATPLEAWPSNS